MAKTSNTLSNLEVAGFCNQMAMILKSGISSIEGVTILLEDSKSPGEKRLLETIQNELSTSGVFHEALKATHVFPPYLLNMVNIGEQTGKLDEVMEALGKHYTREDNISKIIKNALTYPIIMIVMMVLVIVILLVRVMPIFNQMFEQLGREMTGFSKSILQLGQAISRYSVVLAIIAAVIVIFILFLTKTKTGQAIMLTIGYKLPFTRGIYEKTAACRFASGMALTLSSGMSPGQCFDLVGDLVTDRFFRKKLDKSRSELEEGKDFSAALVDTGIFSGIYAKMTAIAAKTGSLDEVMQQIAEQYEDDIDYKITNVISTLEPTLVIILSVIVGAILLSVMLPLMGIMTSL